MASIENRSRFVVTVQNRGDLTKTFAYTRVEELKAYIAKLKEQDFKPKLSRTNDRYAIRIRSVSSRKQCLYAPSEAEALRIKKKIEAEQEQGLFTDYAKARGVTFADLLARYLREIAPRKRSLDVEGYIINAMLRDAGLPPVDLAEAVAAHKNPHSKWANKTLRRKPGKPVRAPVPATCFIRKSFASLVPEDINEYVDERCQSVCDSTASRELDIFSAVCTLAIDTWRIPVAQSPMKGVLRPSFFNERDRRLRGDEESRLLAAAFQFDAQTSIERRLDELVAQQVMEAGGSVTKYRRLAIIKATRTAYFAEAELAYTHVPWMETFIQFQLMTGARRGETLGLTWDDVNYDERSAFIAESKNGRPRNLALRKDIIELLQRLPRSSEAVFPLSIDEVRDAWSSICETAEIPAEDGGLRVHDLRHEAISRVAEAGANLPGGISLIDLQAYSGHRDIRMLLRYTHLCTPSLAKRLDEAFAKSDQTKEHRGRTRLAKGADITMKMLVDESSREALAIAEGAAAHEQAFAKTPAVTEDSQTSLDVTRPAGAQRALQPPPMGGWSSTYSWPTPAGTFYRPSQT